MKQRVESVDCRLDILLANGDIINLELDKFAELKNLSNYITNINIKEELSASTDNPVGVVSSNTLNLELKSVDKNLMSENKNSPYYGYMNDTAIIKVILEDELGDITFGTWYVDRWYSSISNRNPYKVTIEAYDLFSSVGKSELPKVKLGGELLVKDLLIDIFNKYNESISNINRRINFNEADLDFSTFPVLQYNNMNVASMGDLLNSVSQATLTHIMWDRNNNVVTDYVGDDTVLDSVCDLDDHVNITDAQDITGALVNYTGVKVNYAVGTINKPASLVRLDGQTLTEGENRFDNIRFSGSVRKINYVDIITTDNDAVIDIKNIDYTKDSLDLILESNKETACSINIYGQTVNNSILFVEKYINDKDKSVLEMNNSIIRKSDVDNFADKMLELITLKSKSIKLVGWFNPRIKLGDIVHVDIETSTGISPNYYKVMGLEWNITSTLKCTMRLMHVVEQ